MTEIDPVSGEWILPPETGIPRRTVLLLCGGPEDGFPEKVRELRGDPQLLYAGVSVSDWDAAYSPFPWISPAGRRFAGEADETGNRLLRLLERISREYGPAEKPLIAGYSLGGLAALYLACMNPGRFGGCVSCSGSFWFPGFIGWLREHRPDCPAELSLGGKEKNTHDPYMARVEDATKEVCSLCSETVPSRFSLEPGGHFKDPEGRLARCLTRIEKIR